MREYLDIVTKFELPKTQDLGFAQSNLTLNVVMLIIRLLLLLTM